MSRASDGVCRVSIGMCNVDCTVCVGDSCVSLAQALDVATIVGEVWGGSFETNVEANNQDGRLPPGTEAGSMSPQIVGRGEGQNHSLD